jgi:hypothetical protein
VRQRSRRMSWAASGSRPPTQASVARSRARSRDGDLAASMRSTPDSGGGRRYSSSPARTRAATRGRSRLVRGNRACCTCTRCGPPRSTIELPRSDWRWAVWDPAKGGGSRAAEGRNVGGSGA